MCHVCDTNANHNHKHIHESIEDLDSIERIVKPLTSYEVAGDLKSDYAKEMFRAAIREYRLHDDIDFTVLERAMDLKMSRAQSILNGKSAIILENDLNLRTYVKTMFAVFKSRLENIHYSYRSEEWIKNNEAGYEDALIDDQINMFYGKNVSAYLTSLITEDELEKNSMTKKVKVKGKIFNTGTKVTKLLSAISEHYVKTDKDLKEKIVGNLRPQQQSSKILLSAYPTAFIAAGYFGESCLSPDGDNEEGSLAAIGYPNTLMAHTQDFSWRAFVMIDSTEKLFSVFTGYPRENYSAQAVIYSHMKSKGYSLIESGYFRFPAYMSNDDIWPNSFYDVRYNGNSYNTEASDVSWGNTFTNQYAENSEIIVNVYFCPDCGEYKSLHRFDGVCSNCEYNNSYVYCDRCDGRHHDDDMHYVESEEMHMCHDCYNEHYEKSADEYREKLLALARAAQNVVVFKDIEPDLRSIFTDLYDRVRTMNRYDFKRMAQSFFIDYQEDITSGFVYQFVGTGDYQYIRVIERYQSQTELILHEAWDIVDNFIEFEDEE